jgi:alpha-beta hydrolase superfamily lysophospholipase
MQKPDTIVLIHGLFMTALSWEKWVERYTSRGFRVIARSWPGMDVDIEELRRDPSAIEHMGIGEIVDYCDALVRDLDSRPIIVGHSFGGAFTEILVGGADHLVPAIIDKSTADHYARSGAVTEYKLFAGRSHWTIAEPGWEEVADYALEWAIRNAAVPIAAKA